MSCDKPNGDCTNASPCADCGCGSGSTPVVPLPRCNFALPDGVYTHATVTVTAGCISGLASGEPEQYTPEDCCGSGGGGAGTPGPRGFPGPPGAAATVDVEPTVDFSPNAVWTVQNIGTSSAAVFKFTAPQLGGGGGGGGGSYTNSVAGLQVVNGLTTAMPSRIITSVNTVKEGTTANTYLASLGYNLADENKAELKINLDGFAAHVDNLARLRVTALDDALDPRVSAAEATLTAMQNPLSVTSYEYRIAQLELALATLTNRYNNHVHSTTGNPGNTGGPST